MADAPKIKGTDTLRQAYPKLNSAIDNSNEAITKAVGADGKANNAVTTANEAKTKAESVQAQFDQVVIEGDSSVEAAQARVDAGGKTFTTLKDRLDDGDARLAETPSNVLNLGYYGVKGDGVTDDTEVIQRAINDAIARNMDLFIPVPESRYLITEDILITGANNMKISVQSGTKFKTQGNHTGIDIYPQSINVPYHRTFFAIVDSVNVVFSGGIFDCSGFDHPGDGRSGTGILVLRSKGVTVQDTEIVNLAPEGIWGGHADTVNGVTVEIRYVGILGVKTKGLTIKENKANNIAYSAYESRIGCEDTKILNNYAENCGEHLTQSTINYGQMPMDDVLPEDRFNRGIIIAHNTGVGSNTDITFHAQNVTAFGNTLIGLTRRGMSIRDYTDGCEIFGNTILCEGAKGESAFIVTGGDNISIHGNVVSNYKKAFDGPLEKNVSIGKNTFINVDDVGSHLTASGLRSGVYSTGSRLTAYGSESGHYTEGDDNTLIGFRAGRNSVGSRVTAVGAEAGYQNTQNDLTAYGYGSGKGNKGQRSTLIGKDAGQNNTGNGVVLIGREVGINNTFSNVVGIGSKPTADNQFQIDNKHMEMRVTTEPTPPSSSNIRMYVDYSGGVTRMYVMFSNGKKVEIANNIL